MSTRQSPHRSAFETFADRAHEELGDSLRMLLLYGSVARGDETAESDVDVFAVVETADQKRFLERLGTETGVEHGVLLVPIVKTEREYQRMKETRYGREVRETGVGHV